MRQELNSRNSNNSQIRSGRKAFEKKPEIEKFIGCSTVVSFGNVKVGIIGYTTEETPDISDTGTLVFNDVVETVRTESKRLRNKE